MASAVGVATPGKDRQPVKSGQEPTFKFIHNEYRFGPVGILVRRISSQSDPNRNTRDIRLNLTEL